MSFITHQMGKGCRSKVVHLEERISCSVCLIGAILDHFPVVALIICFDHLERITSPSFVFRSQHIWPGPFLFQLHIKSTSRLRNCIAHSDLNVAGYGGTWLRGEMQWLGGDHS